MSKRKKDLKNKINCFVAEFRNESKCTHSDECNGCALLKAPYEKQIEFKKKMLNELFGFEVPIENCIEEFRYRNKIDMAYIDKILGYRTNKNFSKSFKVTECLLVSKKMNLFINLISELLKENEIEDADIMSRKNGLGYVTLRESQKNEILINFVFFGEIDEKINGVCEKLSNEGAASINLLFNETWSDTAYGKIIKSFGKNFIFDYVLGKKFKVGPNTFFQTNVKSAERIFSELKEKLPNKGKILDVYCGVGTISICIAEKCSKIKGIEIVEESILSAKENAEINGITNSEFIVGSARKELKEIEKDFDAVIVDPPRSGLDPKTIKRILEISAKMIFYVSCNPNTLAENLKEIEGYKIELIKGFDQFPQTPHIEMLCILVKEPNVNN